MTIGNARLYLGDCRAVLPSSIPKFDAIVTDPPYGVTDHEWDETIDPALWMACGAVCFAVEPFATELITQAPERLKYDLVWVKNTASNTLNAKIQPTRSHERILVFGDLPYYPQKRLRTSDELQRLNVEQRERMLTANPSTVLAFEAVNNRSGERTDHPSQKPVELLEWLVATYTAPSSVVLDPFMGTGTTGVACANLGRHFIGIERDHKYFNVACDRIERVHAQQRLFA